MIYNAVRKGHLSMGMTKGMFILLHRGGERELLSNWRPISLLNVSYKIYSKMLQKRLQLMLTGVTSKDQLAFLPTRYILDNVFMQHEMIHRVRDSSSRMVLLKLDFRKAYDTMSWNFLFDTMPIWGCRSSSSKW
jgi:hypothetical protein